MPPAIKDVCQAEQGDNSASDPQSMLVPLTPAPAGAITHRAIPKIYNVVSTVNLACTMDLRKIVLYVRNSEYNPKRFHAAIVRILNPKTTALVFPSGKLVITGATSPEAANLAARKFARIFQKIKFPVKFLDFTVQTMLASCDVKFPIQLEGLVVTHSQFARYEPEMFPGVIYRMFKPRVTLLIFVNGKVVLTGAKVCSDFDEAMENIYPVLLNFKKSSYEE